MRVAHEMAGGEKAEIQGVELYDIIKEKPAPQSARTQQGAGTGTGRAGLSAITIREMLSGAKYFAAVKAGDMETAQRIVDQRAARQGYVDGERKIVFVRVREPSGR